MPIGKKGQWMAEINGDEVSGEELIWCVIHENMGLGLPVLQLSFRTQDEAKAKKYNEPDHKITVGMGVDSIEMVATFTTFSKKVAPSEGADNWSVKVDAVYDSMDYLTLQRCRVFTTTDDLKKSSEVWSEVCSGVGLTPETSPSNDKMLWLQHNSADRKFLEEVTWHGYWAVDDPCLHGIRRDGKAIYKPISELKTVKGVIGQTESADIKANDFTLSQNEGFLTAWSGNDRRHPYHHFERGLDLDNEGAVSPKISPTSGTKSTVSKVQEIQYLNDNMHDNWHVAYRQNRQFRASMSGTLMKVVHTGYKPIFILDTWEVKMVRQGNLELLTPYNGDWMVTSVVCAIEKSGITQHISLNREVLL